MLLLLVVVCVLVVLVSDPFVIGVAFVHVIVRDPALDLVIELVDVTATGMGSCFCSCSVLQVLLRLFVLLLV